MTKKKFGDRHDGVRLKSGGFEKIWGCLFGMIPGIVFVGLSTNETGQVINIEFPLGMIIIGFYVGCGIGIYRKQYLQKKKR